MVDKSAGMLGEAWKAMNTPLPNTPKLIAGRNLGILKGEATEVAKKVAPKTVEEMQAARRASRAASWKPKTAALLAFSLELEKLAMDAGNLGQWWDQVGGPFLAKGGSHAEFEKMIDSAGFSDKKKRLMRMAENHYPKNFNTRRAAPPPAPKDVRPPDSAPFGRSASGRPNPNPAYQSSGGQRARDFQEDVHRIFQKGKTVRDIGITTGLAALGYTAFAPKKTSKVEEASSLKAHVGALSSALPAAVIGFQLGQVASIGGALSGLKTGKEPHALLQKAPFIGAAVGALLGGALGEHSLSEAIKEAPRMAEKALKKGETGENKLKELAKKTPAGWASGNLLSNALLLPLAPALGGALLTSELGRGAVRQHQHQLAHKHVGELKEKAAFTQSVYGPTGGFVDFHQVSSQPGMKRPSLRAPVEKGAHFFDDEIPKQAGAITPSGLTPQARLSSSMQIGQPKVTNPSGPSIAQIAKPKGFGTPLPGATLG